MKTKQISQTFLLILPFFLFSCSQMPEWSDEQITEYWTSGKTLPSEVLKQYPLPEQELGADKGYNVLIDMAHECNFTTLWTLPKQLNHIGYRSVGSHASINTVLDPKGESRIRMVYDTVNKVHPFVWMPNPEFQLIITGQNSADSQIYTEEELLALLEWVKAGGGLLVQGKSACRQITDIISTEQETSDENKMDIEKGRVWFSESTSDLRYPGRANQEQKDSVDLELKKVLEWLIDDQKAMKDEPRLPEPMWGGGGIYPELEDNFNNIVFYWAANQKEELLKTVNVDIPKAQQFIQERLPSKPTAEPMYLILCAGNGGGWAVNAYRPKENGIISLNPHGILSIFGHELAHTMHGPTNDDGEVAGNAPIPNRGEAHAGWYQGKVNALFRSSDLEMSNRNCNSMFEWDPEGNGLDLATEYENEALNKNWGKGKDWTKTWYIWQKLDDRYGPTWYPRWKYVQHTRWKSDPDHSLSWDEMVTDMSIAVGEDLFPFMRKAGTTLETERLEEIEFNGEILKLNVAPIEVTPGGNVRNELIGDYRNKLVIKE
ncbi:MAG: hypothetical protein HOD37_05235 [Bacteroidetes bacterium]|nr:hypothetical protein [Bacteroidota bacterium]